MLSEEGLSRAEKRSLTTGSKNAVKAPDPASIQEEKEYWDVYRRHVVFGQPVLDIARADGVSRSTIDRIIAWCRDRLGTPAGGPAVEDLVMSLLDNHRRYVEMIAYEEAKHDKNVKVILSLMKEDRANSVTLAKVKSWLQTNIQVGDKIVHVELPECAVKPSDRAINITPEEITDAEA